MKYKTTLFLLLICLPFALNGQVVINEFSAANYNDATDNFSEYSDWVELYNTSNSAIDISGYFLSDRESNPTKWSFPPGTVINAMDHLRVWCSKRNDISAPNNLHTNFGIQQTKSNDVIVFSDTSGIILDINIIEIPNQTNHSWGRMPDGGANWVVFTNPTPNQTNTTNNLEGYAPKPGMFPQAGFYAGPVSVEMIIPPFVESIYYTLDGTKPDENSLLYSEAFNLTQTTVVRAIAYSSLGEMLPSPIETNTYFIDENHQLYTVSISGDEINDLLAGAQIEPKGTFELFDRNSGSFLTESTGEFNEHGNDSWAYPQRGIDYISRDQFGINGDLDYPIFDNKDRAHFQRVILMAAGSDNYPFEDGACHLRDPLVQELSQRGNLVLDERSYESCVLYVNGEYWGIYGIREKVDDNDYFNYYCNQTRHSVQYIKTWGGTWAEYGGPQTLTDWEALHDYVLSNDMTDSLHYNYVKSQLELESLMDYMILNLYTVNSDWLNWNTSWWRGLDSNGEGKKWRYSLWDSDATFAHYANFTGIPDQDSDASVCSYDDIDAGGDPQKHIDVLEALLQNEEFYNAYINRWACFNNTIFSCDDIMNLLNELVTEIQGEMPRHIQRWGGTEAEWLDNVLDLRNFILDRCAGIDGLMLECYDITGPHKLLVSVYPPNSGQVNVLDKTAETYPYSTEYYGNVPINLQAIANENWEFSHWEIKNQALLPDTLSEEVNLVLTMEDSLVAHFTPITISALSSISEDANLFDVFPSPASNKVLVKLNNGQHFSNVSIQVHTVQGNEIYRSNIEEGNHDFTVNNWGSGVYIVSIYADGHLLGVEKLLVQ